jgi:hypothetical protein
MSIYRDFGCLELPIAASPRILWVPESAPVRVASQDVRRGARRASVTGHGVGKQQPPARSPAFDDRLQYEEQVDPSWGCFRSAASGRPREHQPGGRQCSFQRLCGITYTVKSAVGASTSLLGTLERLLGPHLVGQLERHSPGVGSCQNDRNLRRPGPIRLDLQVPGRAAESGEQLNSSSVGSTYVRA